MIKWLSIQDASEFSGLTRLGVLELIRHGQVRSRTNDKGRWEVDSASLKKYLASLPEATQKAATSRTRLVALLELLNEHVDWSIPQFAAALRVDNRSVERYFADLRKLGYRITWTGKGYKISDPQD